LHPVDSSALGREYPGDADRFSEAGVTMFVVSVLASEGYDLTEAKEALAWRD
jgi:hypothetical protein